MTKQESSDPIDSVPPEIRELYTVQRRIGEGQYGEVFVGTDKKTNEVVAIKKNKLSINKDGVCSIIPTLPFIIYYSFH